MTSLLANLSAMLAARLLPPLFSFAINVAIARLHGSADLGAYAVLISLLLVFQAMSGAGMSLLLVREIAAHPARMPALLRDARAVGLATGVLATLVFVAYALASGGSTVSAALVLSASLVPSAWITVYEAAFIARGQHHAVTVIAAVENAIKLVLALIVVAFGGSLALLCGAITASRIVAFVAAWRLGARQGIRAPLLPEARGVWELARALPPFAIMLVLAVVYFRVDVLVIERLRGAAETGLYAAALTLFSMAMLLPDSAMAAVYPRLARSFQRKPEEFAPAVLLSARLLSIALTPVAIALIALATPLLTTIYGSSFADAAIVLAWLAASLPLHGLNATLGRALQAGGEAAVATRVLVWGTILHCLLAVALVRSCGLLGAPIAGMLSSGTVALVCLYEFHRRIAPIETTPQRALWSASAVVGPIALVLAAPKSWELAAAVAALSWVAAALVADRPTARAEVQAMLGSLRSPSPG